MAKSVFGLILFFWLALHTSQSLMDVADFLLIVTALWTAYKNREMKKLWTSFRPWALGPVWVLVIILGFVFGAPTELNVAVKLVWEFRWIVSLLCFIYLFRSVEWNEKQLRSLTVLFLLIGIMDLVLFFVDYQRDPRAGGLFGHSMPFAHTIGPAALFFMFIGFKKAREKAQPMLWKAVYLATPLLASAMMVLSFTRGVWIGFVVALLFSTVFLGRKVFVSTVLALVVAGGVIFATSQRIQNRVLGKTTAESQSDNERLLYWKANLQIFRDFPVFGIGYSQNNVHVEEYLKKDGVEWLRGAHAHNQYIHFLAGTGILGLGCFLTFLYFLSVPILKTALLKRRKAPQSDTYYLLIGVLAAIVCFLVGALTESNFSIAKNRFLFLFIASIGYAIYVNTFSNPIKKK